MKRLLLLPLLATAACQRITPADRAAALETIRRNLAATQGEKIEEMMATIHPKSPFREETRAQTAGLFERFDIRYELTTLEIVAEKRDELRVRFEQVMEKTAGEEPFPKCKVAGVHVLRRDGGEWKIFDGAIMSRDELEPAAEVAE